MIRAAVCIALAAAAFGLPDPWSAIAVCGAVVAACMLAPPGVEDCASNPDLFNALVLVDPAGYATGRDFAVGRRVRLAA